MSELKKGDDAYGQFLVFEGGDGAGKSFALMAAAQVLEDNGIPHIVTSELGGSTFGADIRNFIVQASNEPFTEILALNAARQNHLDSVILPALEKGLVVLCDRYVDSTRANQSIYFRSEREIARRLNTAALRKACPDVIFYIKTDPDVAYQRILTRNNGQSDNRENESKMVQVHTEYELLFSNGVSIHCGSNNVGDKPDPSYKIRVETIDNNESDMAAFAIRVQQAMMQTNH